MTYSIFCPQQLYVFNYFTFNLYCYLKLNLQKVTFYKKLSLRNIEIVSGTLGDKHAK